MTDEERLWCDRTMQISHHDVLINRLVTVHLGPFDPSPPKLVAGTWCWPDGSPDSGLIDWGSPDEPIDKSPAIGAGEQKGTDHA